MDAKLAILVVEDDEALNNLIARRLSREGHTCVQLHSGRSCVEWLKANRPDMMILDLGLPDMNGDQVVDELEAAGLSVPFLVATGQGSEAMAVKMLKRGARDYLVKNSELASVLPAAVEMVWKDVELQRRLQEAERRIRFQNATLSAVHNLAPQGIMVVDRSGAIISHNGALLRLLGLDALPPGADGRSIALLIASRCGNPSHFLEAVSRCDSDPEAEVNLKDVAAGDAVFELHATPMRPEPGQPPVGRVWYFSDVTAFKRAEEAMARAKQEAETHAMMKDHFMSVLSHDVKTPLNSIIGFTDLLEATPLEDAKTRAEYLNYIKDSSAYLLTLVNDILDLSKIEHGAIVLDISRFNIKNLLSRCVDSFKHQAMAKGVELVKEFAPGVPETAVGDELRLRQIATNLMANAVKYTFKGSVTLRCALEGSDRLRLTVSDTGVGIKEEFQKVMFAPFSQETSTVSKKLGGTGIGLSIVKHLVHIFNGEISVESAVGKGTAFHVVFPLDLSKAKPPEGVTTIYSV